MTSQEMTALACCAHRAPRDESLRTTDKQLAAWLKSTTHRSIKVPGFTLCYFVCCLYHTLYTSTSWRHPPPAFVSFSSSFPLSFTLPRQELRLKVWSFWPRKSWRKASWLAHRDFCELLFRWFRGIRMLSNVFLLEKCGWLADLLYCPSCLSLSIQVQGTSSRKGQRQNTRD